MDVNPIITRNSKGEYSTIYIGNRVETVWFPDDDQLPSEVIGFTVLDDKRTIAARHIAAFENRGA